MIHRITSKERTSIDKPKIRVRKLNNKSCEGLCLRVKTDSQESLQNL